MIFFFILQKNIREVVMVGIFWTLFCPYKKGRCLISCVKHFLISLLTHLLRSLLPAEGTFLSQQIQNDKGNTFWKTSGIHSLNRVLLYFVCSKCFAFNFTSPPPSSPPQNECIDKYVHEVSPPHSNLPVYFQFFLKPLFYLCSTRQPLSPRLTFLMIVPDRGFTFRGPAKDNQKRA